MDECGVIFVERASYGRINFVQSNSASEITCGEAGLQEVLVASQRLDDASIAHDDEGNVVGQRPVFVRARGVKRDGHFRQRPRRGHDADSGAGLDVAIEIHETLAVADFAQTIGEFGDDPVGGDAEEAGVAAVSDGALMQWIGAVENGEKEKSVREDRPHFRGNP